MKSIFTFFLLQAGLCYCPAVFAYNKHNATGENNRAPRKQELDFIENMGQWNMEARFKASIPEGVFFLTDEGFVYNFVGADKKGPANDTSCFTHEPPEIKHHAYRVNFIGHNRNIQYSKEGKRDYYHNYYLGKNPATWAGKVGIYGKTTQHNVYNGIDVVVYSKGNHLKYDFKVAAGASVAQIEMEYKGVTPEITSEGSLLIRTTVNEIREEVPYSYQIVGGKEKAVASVYKLVDGKLTFEFPQGYDTTLPLVIDPELIYSTYSGASYIPPPSFYAYEGISAHSTTYDTLGNLYVGAVLNSLGWPVTLGAFQTALDEKRDIGINVYNPNGSSLIYSTYYGGASNEVPLTMIVNKQNELIVAGSTRSENLPVTSGCYDSTFNGTSTDFDMGTDIFVAHFNNGGSQLIGATYLGGSEDELIPSNISMDGTYIANLFSPNIISPLELTLDSIGNIWLIGNTGSTNFPVTGTALQPLYAGGEADLVLCKLNPECSQLLYSSFMGGTDSEIGHGILFNKAGNIVICGSTRSNDFPVTSGTLLDVAPGGEFDGFVSVLNPANGSILQATYLGTIAADEATMIQVDTNNHIYVTGRTYGDYPISANVFSIPKGDVFMDKLSADLSSSISSTRLGNFQENVSRMIPTGFVLTNCNEIIFSGVQHGLPADSLPVSADALNTEPRQFWFCALRNDFSQLSYASFWGADSYFDYRYAGTSHYDPKGIIYQSLTNIWAGFPTSIGAWSPTSQIVSMYGKPDPVSFKISFVLNADFKLDAALNGNDSGCAPYSVQMINTSTGADMFTWDFGDGSPLTNSFAPPMHTYTLPGTYTVTLYAHNDTACVSGDTAIMTITVLNVVQPDISLNDTVLCNLQQSIDISVQINNPNPGFDILWGPQNNGILSAADQAVVTVNPLQNNNYYVTVTDSVAGICGAWASDSIHIDALPASLDIINQDTVVCEGAIINIVATGNPGYTYRWVPANGISDTTALQPSIQVYQPEIYTLTASNPNCPDTSVLFSVDMDYVPQVELGEDKRLCQGMNAVLESLVSPYRTDYSYEWSPFTSSLSDPTGPNTYFVADTSITYMLTVQTPIGCTGFDTVHITVSPGVVGSVTPDTGYCPGHQVQLLATGGVTYIWSPDYGLNDSTIANPIASPQTNTVYTVFITNEYLCSDTETVSVQVYSGAVVTMPDSISVYPGEQYHLEPNTNCLYFSWFPPSGINNTTISDPTFKPEVRTRYFVTASTEHGCTLKDSIDVLVKETVLDMPNAFMPTGNNNLFKPSLRGIAALKQFCIFNRWGNKVYSSNNINEGWDGTYNNQPQPVGVYVYTIEAVKDNGQVFIKKGNVTLVR